MKTKLSICILAILCILTFPVPADEIYIENHSFEEPGDGKTHGWDEDDGAYYVEDEEPAEVPGWESEGEVIDSGVSYETDQIPTVEDGLWYGYIMGNDPTVWQLTDHTIAAGEVFTLTFDAYNCYDGPEVQANLYYDDNGTRVVVASGNVTGLEHGSGYAVPGSVVFIANDVPGCIGKNIGVEFDNPLRDEDFRYGTWTAMDNVQLNVELYHAGVVYPPHNGTDIGLDVVLEWSLDEGYTCDVYFGTIGDPNVGLNPKVLSDSLLTTYDPPGDLAYDTTYYWRVDTIDPNDGSPVTLTGMTWTFRTLTEEVQIITEPQSVTVATGGTAEFSVEASSPTPISYEWFMVRPHGPPSKISEEEILTIPNVQLGDEGKYFCELTNSLGTVTSAQARLLTQRLMGWWKLDGNLNDSVDTVVSGATTHDGVGTDPDYITGIDGSGVEFFADGRIVTVPETGDYFNFHPQGITVSLWVKTSNGGWEGVISKQLREADPAASVGWLIGVNARSDWGPTGAHFTVRPNADLFGSDHDGNIFDGQWHLVTAVMDPVSQTNRIYIDGAQRNESEVYDFGSITMNEEILVFGAEDQLGAVPYTGQIDDVRIWNYPLASFDIASLYLEFHPGEDVCISGDEQWRHFDVVGEPGESSFCRLDIEDMAEFVTSWMECNLVPSCLP
jgi:hypothetical protein